MGRLNALKVLHLLGCSNLKKLLSSIDQLSTFQKVSFVMVFQLEKITFIYSSLIALENLDLCECFNLQELLTCTLAN
jgi:hypothetical protein